MPTLEKIDIAHDELPLRLIIELSDTEYALEFQHNKRNDFYTVIVKDISTDNVLYSSVLRSLRNFLKFFYNAQEKLIPANLDNLDDKANNKFGQKELKKSGIYIL